MRETESRKPLKWARPFCGFKVEVKNAYLINLSKQFFLGFVALVLEAFLWSNVGPKPCINGQ